MIGLKPRARRDILMSAQLTSILAIVSALGCGLMAGFFFSFSVCVMKALAQLPPAKGIAAMQAINVVVLNRWFFIVFFGTAGLCLLLAAEALWNWQQPGAAPRFAGCAFYLLGTLGVTIVCNVPRNNALAAVDPDTAAAASRWASYLSEWTAWNHVRTAAAVAALGLFVFAQR